MRRILFKRYPRELKANLFRYLSLFLLITFCMFLIISIVDAAERVIRGTERNQAESVLEDGQITVFSAFTEDEIKTIEEAGITIEPHFSFEYTLKDGTNLRLFVNREKIDKVVLDCGKSAEKEDEIVLEKRYAEENGYTAGSKILIGEKELTVTGIGSSVDYDAPYRKLSDTIIDSKSFGVGFLTKEGYAAVKKTGGGSEELTYAFLLGDNTATEFKEMVKDFEFDYKKVEDPYYQEMLKDTYGKKDEITDGINDLLDGVKELADGVDELKDGTGELTDGMEELYDGSVELYDGIKKLKDGVGELKDGVDDLKTQSDEMLEKLFDQSPDNITAFMLKDENIRIGGAAGDLQMNRSVGLLAGVIVMVLFTYVLSVFVIHQIQSESSVIGALYSLGVRKKELVSHYITLPTLVCFLGGLCGGLLGLCKFGSDTQMGDTYSYYSVPWFGMMVPLYLVIYAVAMPPLVSALVNYIVINKSLSRTALSLLRNEQKAGRRNNIRLGKMNFINTYRIRQLLREIRTALTILFGMIISLLVLMMGLDCYVLCENAGRLNSEDVKYQYMYTYKYPSETPPEGGEAVYIQTLKKEQYGFNLDITVMGIDDDNPYLDVKTVPGKNKIVASDSVAVRYKVGVGDKIIFSDTANDIDYAFTVAEIVPYSVGLTVFMDIDDMRDLFGEEEDYYNAVMADRELEIEEGRLYSVTSKADIDKAAGIFLKLMQSMFVTLIGASAVIFGLVMYLMIAVMIDRSSFGISLLKIFGFRRGEIKKLYLDGNRLMIIAGAVIAVPVAKWFMDMIFPSFIGNVACAIHLEFPWYLYLIIFAGILITYELINFFMMGKLGRISQTEVLKNRE